MNKTYHVILTTSAIMSAPRQITVKADKVCRDVSITDRVMLNFCMNDPDASGETIMASFSESEVIGYYLAQNLEATQ